MAQARKKQVTAVVRLEIPAGEATPSPPVGPALGQHGLNLPDFCKDFNNHTKHIDKGLPVPVVVTVYEDRKYEFKTKTTPAAFLLKKAAALQKGSGRPNTEKLGSVTRQQLEEIAHQKQANLTSKDLEAAVRTIAGTARSMGIEVKSS